MFVGMFRSWPITINPTYSAGLISYQLLTGVADPQRVSAETVFRSAPSLSSVSRLIRAGASHEALALPTIDNIVDAKPVRFANGIPEDEGGHKVSGNGRRAPLHGERLVQRRQRGAGLRKRRLPHRNVGAADSAGPGALLSTDECFPWCTEQARQPRQSSTRPAATARRYRPWLNMAL